MIKIIKDSRKNRDTNLYRVFIFIVSLTLSTNANSSLIYEPQQNIKDTAKSFLEEMTNTADILDTEINIGNIDPRLKLKKCTEPLIAYLPQGSKSVGKINVGVKCNAPIQWKVFLSATNYQYQTVIFVKRSLKKGQIITKQDLGTKRVKINSRNKQPVIDFEQAILTSPRRFIRSGSILYTESICMVCRGQKVKVSTGNEFFTINVEAEALADASIGEVVRLRNETSRRVFDGQVIGRNKAQVFLLK